MDKVTKYLTTREELNGLVRRAVHQPRDSSNASWDFYFRNNPGIVLAGALALKKFGEHTVVKAQGEAYYIATRGEIFAEFVTGKRKDLDKEAYMVNRGRKYLYHLKRWLKNNPVPENNLIQYEADELVKEEQKSAEQAA